MYSGDTGYSEDFASFAKNADLLILESALPAGEDFENHCTPSEAAKLAAFAEANATMLTHFYPQVDVENIPAIAQQFYHGELIIAEDGLTYSVKGS
ncbi:MAG: Ribonuclease BN [Candidatus Marinimicrobia bacterium]|nr:Ribonuclease BN [Candidatus Neomarinimicrobiota bacterium]